MVEAGYYLTPTIYGEKVVFACEDDLWTVSADGGVARRLTSNPGRASTPALSPNDELLAFTGRDEGNKEIYVMTSEGGGATRLTYLGANTQVTGWTPDSASIVFSSEAGQPFGRRTHLYGISPEDHGEDLAQRKTRSLTGVGRDEPPPRPRGNGR